MRRLLEFGPSAALYIFALAAQVSGFVSPIAALLLAIIGTLLLFVPACHHCHVWHMARKSGGRRGLDSWCFIAPRLVIAILAVAGAAYGFGLRSSGSPQESKGTPTQSASLPVKEEFFKNATITLGIGDEIPIAFGGTSTLTTERLRVFVDYSMYRSGWMSRVRVAIGEIKDPVKGQFVRIQLAYKGTKPNGGNLDLWWGSNPAPAHPIQTPIYANEPVATVRGRVAMVGPDNKEQYTYFELMRAPNENGQFRILILQGRAVDDWISKWEADS
jgi:hypothetical protein